MGKTDKQKTNEKAKGAKKDAAKDKPSQKKVKQGGAAKKKKWTAGKQKDKLNNAVYWSEQVHDRLVKDLIAKEAYITPSIVSEKLKVNVSCAREALQELLKKQFIAPVDDYSSKYCCFVKGPNYTVQEKPKKEAGAKGEKGNKGKKEGGQPKEKKPKKEKK